MEIRNWPSLKHADKYLFTGRRLKQMPTPYTENFPAYDWHFTIIYEINSGRKITIWLFRFLRV